MGRLGNPQQWSTPAGGVLVRPAVVGTEVTQVLNARFRAAECGNDGEPQVEPALMTFRLRVTDGPPGQNTISSALPQSLAEDAVELTWGVGGSTFTARLDVVGGVCVATVFCDWLNVGFRNASKTSAGATVQCVAAPAMGGEERGGRRSVRFTLPAAGNVDVTVEPGAQSVELVIPSQGPTGVLVACRDSLGVTVCEFVACPLGAPGVNSRIVIPGGTAVLRLSNNPAGVALSCVALFFVPL